MSKPDSSKILGLQHARWWAAGTVAFYHASRLNEIAGYDGIGINLRAAGDFSVQTFFVISGFIITIICLKDGQPRLGPREFFERRFLRIVPLMWVSILFYLFMKMASGDVDWPAIARSFVLWPSGGLKPGLLWTIRVEILFYIVFALCFLTFRKWSWVFLLWIFAPIVSRLLPWDFATANESGDTFYWVFFQGHQTGANLQFGAGMALGMLWMQRSWPMTLSLPGGSFSIALVWIVALSAMEMVARLEAPAIITILLQTLAATTVVWVALLSSVPTTGLGRAGVFLGDASYSIYLFHVLPQSALGVVLAKTGLLGVPSILACTGIAIISILFGALIYLVVERPLLDACRRYFKLA